MAAPGSAQDARVADLPDYENAAEWAQFFVANNKEMKTVSDLYARLDTLTAMESGQPAPDGAVIVRVSYAVVLNDEGFPFKDADGNFAKGPLSNIWVMEKRQGWGDDGGAGDWEFAAFRRTGGRIQGDGSECAECHEQAADTDYVFNFSALVAAGSLL